MFSKATIFARRGFKVRQSVKFLSTTSLIQNYPKYETLIISTVAPKVAHVEINRPDKLNAMNKAFWREIKECFDFLHEDTSCRAIVLSGKGKHFTAGIDISDLGDFVEIIQSDLDIARKCKKTAHFVRSYQASFTSLEKCSKPVIAAIHNGCIGGGVDVICSADIRYCTKDAWFQVKEVDIGMAADVGTLQRLPRVVGNESLVRELAFTARKMHSDEAEKMGLVSRVFDDKSLMIDAAVNTATLIASKSPVAVQGSKINIIYSRDHTVEEGLDYMINWNMTMLQSQDLMKAVMAQMSKSKPDFDDL